MSIDSSSKTTKANPAKNTKRTSVNKPKNASNKRLVNHAKDRSGNSEKATNIAQKGPDFFGKIWRSALAVLSFSGLFIASQIIVAIFFSVVLAVVFDLLDANDLIGGKSLSAMSEEIFSNMWVVLLLMSISSILTFIGSVLLVKLFNRNQKSWRKILLIDRWPIAKDFAFAPLGFGLYWLMNLVVILPLSLVENGPVDVEQSQDLGVVANSLSSTVAAFALLVILPPLIEEFLFRGAMLQTIKRWMPLWLAAIIVSVVFGAMHLELLSGNPPNWIAMIDTTVMSLAIIITMRLHKSLWPAIFIHAIKNFVAFSILFIFN